MTSFFAVGALVFRYLNSWIGWICRRDASDCVIGPNAVTPPLLKCARERRGVTLLVGCLVSAKPATHRIVPENAVRARHLRVVTLVARFTRVRRFREYLLQPADIATLVRCVRVGDERPDGVVGTRLATLRDGYVLQR